MQVLLVEDHCDTRSVLVMLLSRCGCQIVSANSLKAAQTRLDEIAFDVLVTDLNLPDGDGIDLVREAKSKFPDLRTIALTGRASQTERDAGLQSGCDLYLTKPIDFQELREALDCSGRGTAGAR